MADNQEELAAGKAKEAPDDGQASFLEFLITSATRTHLQRDKRVLESQLRI